VSKVIKIIKLNRFGDINSNQTTTVIIITTNYSISISVNFNVTLCLEDFIVGERIAIFSKIKTLSLLSMLKNYVFQNQQE